MSINKAKAQRLHAIRRAWQRYGIKLNTDSYEALCKKIQNGDGEFMGRQSNRKTVWRIYAPVQVEGIEWAVQVNVIYDKTRKSIVTFLPVGIISAKGIDLKSEELE